MAGSEGIHYVCLNREHAKSDLGNGHFTVRSGTWGYCAQRAPSDDHQWHAIENVIHGSPAELGQRIHGLLRSVPDGPDHSLRARPA
jgi:hypothetical protein